MPVILTEGRAAKIQTDTEVDQAADDKLEYTRYATALGHILDDPELETPITLSINGPWGSGKSTLGRLVAENLASRSTSRGHHIFEFDAWQNEVGRNGANPLLRLLAQDLGRQRGGWTRVFKPLPLSLTTSRMRRWRLLLTVVLGVVCLGGALSITPVAAFVEGWNVTLPLQGVPIGPRLALLALLSILLAAQIASRGLETLAKFLRNPDEGAAHEKLDKVRREFDDLVAAAIERRQTPVLVIVDNLDRCQPYTIKAVLEATNKALRVPDVIVILLADVEVLARRLKIDEGQANTDPAESYEYLEKMISVPFDLPVVAVSSLVRKLAVSALDDEPLKPKASTGRGGVWPLIAGPVQEVWDPYRNYWARGQQLPPAIGARVGNGWAAAFSLYVYWWTLGPLVVLRTAILSTMEKFYPHRERHLAESRQAAMPHPPAQYRAWVIAHMAGACLVVPVMVLATFLEARWLPTVFFFYLAVTLVVPCRIVAAQMRKMHQEDAAVLEVALQRGRQSVGADDGGAFPTELRTLRVPAEALVTAFLVGRFRALVDELDAAAAEARFIDFLRPTPRHVKRYKNRFRIVRLIAENNGLLVPALPTVTEAHLQKWVVLEERWPAVARSIRLDPTFSLAYSDTSDLAAFMATAPRLEEVLPFLVTMSREPWPGPPKAAVMEGASGIAVHLAARPGPLEPLRAG